MMRLLAAAALLLLLTMPARAQRVCDQWTFKTDVQPNAPLQLVPSTPDRRVYICGYTATGSADFRLISGVSLGGDCASNVVPMTPVLTMPPDGILINRIPYVAEFTDYGRALCVERTGQSGTLSITVYFAVL